MTCNRSALCRQRVEELLLRWEEQRRNGKPVSVDTLCRDCPELRDELLAQIAALEKMDRVLALSGQWTARRQNRTPPKRYDDLRPGWEPIAGYRL